MYIPATASENCLACVNIIDVISSTVKRVGSFGAATAGVDDSTLFTTRNPNTKQLHDINDGSTVFSRCEHMHPEHFSRDQMLTWRQHLRRAQPSRQWWPLVGGRQTRRGCSWQHRGRHTGSHLSTPALVRWMHYGRAGGVHPATRNNTVHLKTSTDDPTKKRDTLQHL